YQFIGNRVSIDTDWPPLEQVNGRIDFTEGGASMRAVNAQFLGGPVVLSMASQRDGSIGVYARGTLNAALLQSVLERPLLRQVSGAAAWSSSMNFSKRGASIVVESGLQGIASALP